MQLKSTTRVGGLSPQMAIALMIVRDEFSARDEGDFTIVEASDGKEVKSVAGHRFSVEMQDLNWTTPDQMAAWVSANLGVEYDVRLSPDKTIMIVEWK